MQMDCSIHTLEYVCLCECVCVCVCVCVRAHKPHKYIKTHVHTKTCSHTHIHTHTQQQQQQHSINIHVNTCVHTHSFSTQKLMIKKNLNLQTITFFLEWKFFLKIFFHFVFQSLSSLSTFDLQYYDLCLWLFLDNSTLSPVRWQCSQN